MTQQDNGSGWDLGFGQRGCVAIVLAVIVLVGAFFFLHGGLGGSTPAATATPGLTPVATLASATATPSPSASRIESPTSTSTSPSTSGGPSIPAFASFDATISGSVTLHATGGLFRACPIATGATSILLVDAADSAQMSIGFQAYAGPATYRLAGATTPATLAFQSGQAGTSSALFRATSGSITTNAAGGATFQADLAAATASEHIHIDGSITCP